MKQLEQIYFNADAGAGNGGAPGTGDAGAGAAGANTQKGSSMFSGTMIEKKDPVSGQTIQIPKELEPFIGHIISSTRNSIEGQYKPLVEKLEGDTVQLSEVRAELEKFKEANMSAEERAQANAARKIAEYEAKTKNAMQDASDWRSRFEKSTITNDILSAFGDSKLCNPGQTAILLRNEGNAEVVDVIGSDGKPTGEFQTRLSLNLVNEKTGEVELVTGTPKDLFKRWIKQDDNLHHLANNLLPGGGSSSGRKGSIKGTDWMNMSASERLRRAREQQQ